MDEDALEGTTQTAHLKSQLEQDLYLSDSAEEDDDDVCHEVDEETKEQARLMEEMIVDESENETSHDPHDSSKSISSTSTNTNKLSMKSFYEEVDGQENVSNRKYRKVKCKLCKLGGKVKLISLGNYSRHIRDRHEKEQEAKCPHCDKNLKIGSLSHHIRDVHKGEDKVKVRCPICDKEMSKSYLRKHMKKIHGSGKDKANGDKQIAQPPSRAITLNVDHQEEVDEEVATFGSPHRGKRTSNPSLITRESPRKKKFKCKCCAKEFLLSRALKSHQQKCQVSSREGKTN
jgi:hypothetical protein